MEMDVGIPPAETGVLAISFSPDEMEEINEWSRSRFLRAHFEHSPRIAAFVAGYLPSAFLPHFSVRRYAPFARDSAPISAN